MRHDNCPAGWKRKGPGTARADAISDRPDGQRIIDMDCIVSGVEMHREEIVLVKADHQAGLASLRAEMQKLRALLQGK